MPSWPGSSRPSTSLVLRAVKTWMPGIADKFTRSAQGRPLWPGMTRKEIISLPDLARIHLDRRVEQPGRKRGFNGKRLFHAEIVLHQLVILFHPLGVDPAQRPGGGELVG